jgi:hypothetical protein
MPTTEMLFGMIENASKQYYQLKFEQANQTFSQIADYIAAEEIQEQLPREIINHIYVVLNECMGALAQKDYILVADLLKHEIIDLVVLNDDSNLQ